MESPRLSSVSLLPEICARQFSTRWSRLFGFELMPAVAETTGNSLQPTGLTSNANQSFISTPESRPRQLCVRWMGLIRNDRLLTNWGDTDRLKVAELGPNARRRSSIRSGRSTRGGAEAHGDLHRIARLRSLVAGFDSPVTPAWSLRYTAHRHRARCHPLLLAPRFLSDAPA